MPSALWDRVWIGAELATLEGTGIGHLGDAVLAVRDGRIAWIGTRAALGALEGWSASQATDARGLWITPGFIECHTHLVYAGDRGNEFDARQNGASYEDIARAGGGIVATMRATRAASEDELFDASLPRAAALANDGVTTLEIKSGY